MQHVGAVGTVTCLVDVGRRPGRAGAGHRDTGSHEGTHSCSSTPATRRPVTWTRRRVDTLPCMAGCCPSRDYHRFFNQRFARRLANRYRKRGPDQTAHQVVEFLRELGIEGASVLEIGGGVGEIEIELLKAGAARAQNLELSPAYEHEAHQVAGQAGPPGG